MPNRSRGTHRPLVQDLLNEYLNKPYEDGIYLRLRPRQFGSNTPDVDAEIQKAFDSLPGDEWIIKLSKTTIKFKMLASGYVAERRSNTPKAETDKWNCAIRSAQDFLRGTLDEISDDFSRCENQLQELRTASARTKDATAVLAQAEASLRTMVAFRRLVSSN